MKNVVLNDLYDYKNRKIYQLEDAFKFSLDSIILAEFVNVTSKKQYIVDFCTGNAVIPLILSTKFRNKIYAIEIQPEIFDLAVKSVKYNNLEEQIRVINDNVLNISNYFNNESIDIVICNPPYFKYNKNTLISKSSIKSIARHEITITLEQIIFQASRLLKNGGYFYLVHRSNRLEEIIEILNKFNFRIKELQFVYTKNDKPSQIVLIKALKNGKSCLVVNKPVYISNHQTFQNMFRR